MTRPWKTLDRVESEEGPLELRQRGDSEFLIMVAGRVLMNSAASRSEIFLAEAACARIAGRAAPRVLVGGLGMACTLRAALDALPADARVVVAELNDTVLHWCRGPLAALTGAAVEDPRVEVKIGDVSDAIAQAAGSSPQAAGSSPQAAGSSPQAAGASPQAAGASPQAAGAPSYDAILLDLYEGPHPASQPRNHPHYGAQALARTRRALAREGVFAIWSEDPDAAFEARLAKAGFSVERQRPGRGGRRHVVYLASAASCQS